MITVKCAWCGAIVGTKGPPDRICEVSHTICPTCLANFNAMKTWDGVERRKLGERRKGERRKSLRQPVDRMIVIDRLVWIDGSSGGRRNHIRRQEDRQRLAQKILEGFAP